MKKKNIPRRAFLRGAGTLIALPLLESMIPMSKAFAASNSPKRFAAFYFPHGYTGFNFDPLGTENNWRPPLILEPLAERGVSGDVSVLLNIINDVNTYHPGHCSAFLTSKKPPKSGAPFNSAISCDQVLANYIKKSSTPTKIDSISMSPDSPATGRNENGQSGVYGSNLSWENSTTPAARSIHARQIFDDLFSGSAGPTENKNRVARQKSILDNALADANTLARKVSSSDKLILDQFMSGIRDVEVKISGGVRAGTCSTGTRPEENLSYDKDLKVKMDLLALAFQCDATRVATYVLDYEFSGRNMSFVPGVSSGSYHSISHWLGSGSKQDRTGDPSTKGYKLEHIARYYVDAFSYFVQKLKTLQDGNGSVLDNTTVLFGSGFRDGHNHTYERLPILLAGGKNLGFRPGRAVELATKTPLANVLLTMLRRAGMNVDSFGNSTGNLSKYL